MLLFITSYGELLSFAGQRPANNLEVISGTNPYNWSYNGLSNLPSQLSTSQVFIKYQSDIIFVSSQGALSLFATLNAGNYKEINDKLKNLFSNIGQTTSQKLVSGSFFPSYNFIAIQIDDKTYLYNLNSQSWSSWNIPYFGLLFFVGGRLICLGQDKNALSAYSTGIFSDTSYATTFQKPLETGNPDPNFNGYVFGDIDAGSSPATPTGGSVVNGNLVTPPTSPPNTPIITWSAIETGLLSGSRTAWYSQAIVDNAGVIRWSAPVQWNATTPIQATLQIGYNPLDDDNTTIKNLRSIYLYYKGTSFFIKPTISYDWGKGSISLAEKSGTSTTGGITTWNAYRWTDSLANATSRTLLWSGGSKVNTLNNAQISVGLSARSFSVQFDIATSAPFELSNYDVIYEVTGNII